MDPKAISVAQKNQATSEHRMSDDLVQTDPYLCKVLTEEGFFVMLPLIVCVLIVSVCACLCFVGGNMRTGQFVHIITSQVS